MERVGASGEVDERLLPEVGNGLAEILVAGADVL